MSWEVLQKEGLGSKGSGQHWEAQASSCLPVSRYFNQQLSCLLVQFACHRRRLPSGDLIEHQLLLIREHVEALTVLF